MTSRSVLTYADFVQLPDDGRRYELHEGELSVTPAPGRPHQRILGNLHLILAPHVRASGRGELMLSPFDCIMTDTTVVEPDLVYVDDRRRALLSDRALEGAPTLAVEIISPSSRTIDRRRKLGLYARHGVEYYWIVDPDARTIDAFQLVGDAYEVCGRLTGTEHAVLPPFPDLLLDSAAIWL